MSGVMVERRDHVLMTGGLEPPARAFSTAFTIPLSMNGPFLTERAISLHFQLAIADLKNPQLKLPRLLRISPFPNWRLPIADLKNPQLKLPRLFANRSDLRQSAIGNRKSAIT